MFYSTDKKCDGSFVKMDSKSLATMANQSLDNIKERKKKAYERLIRNWIKEFLEEEAKREKSLWSRLFGFTPVPLPSDDEIIARIEHERDGFIGPSEFFWIDLRYSKYEEVAHRLLNAARYATEVYVSTEDLERLL